MKFVGTFRTAGSGYWSDVEKNVVVIGIDLDISWFDDNPDEEWGELRVYFDPVSWDVEEDGLIYTDPLFETELQRALDNVGLPGNDVGYSEQGMQGADYVSCDVGNSFVKAWKRLNA